MGLAVVRSGAPVNYLVRGYLGYAFETTAVVLGQRRRVILTHSVGLHTAQQVGRVPSVTRWSYPNEAVGRPRRHGT